MRRRKDLVPIELFELPDGWWRVSGRKWTFGLRSLGGVVVDTAPLTDWGRGHDIATVLAWWHRKGADDIRPEGGGNILT